MSAMSGAMSRAGQSRFIRASRAVAASGEVRMSADHFVDIGHRDGEADLQMRGVARLAEQEFGAAGDDLLAEIDEGAQKILEVQHFWPAAVERDHIGAGSSIAAR